MTHAIDFIKVCQLIEELYKSSIYHNNDLHQGVSIKYLGLVSALARSIGLQPEGCETADSIAEKEFFRSMDPRETENLLFRRHKQKLVDILSQFNHFETGRNIKLVYSSETTEEGQPVAAEIIDTTKYKLSEQNTNVLKTPSLLQKGS